MRSVETTFARALKSGVVISVAAGNNNADSCGYTPAFAPSALTVAASNRPRGTKDPRAWFSNYGKCIDIFAPGVSIVSASAKSDTGTASMSGTSMACPHVSGAAALFLGDAKAQGASDLAAVTGLWGKMKAAAVGGTVTDAKTGTPNSMLHVGGPAGPAPTTAPTPAPTTAPTMAPTRAPTSAPTKPPSPTQAPTSPPTKPPTGCQPAAPNSIECQIKKFTEDVGKGMATMDKKVQAADSSMNAKFAKMEAKVEAIMKLLGGNSAGR